MAQFTVNTHRFDPYRNFRFKIKWDNKYVAGMTKCSALKKTTEAIDFREGGDPSHSRKLPGKTSYEAITLEAGLTHDTAFEDWANLVNNFQGDAAMSLRNFRKDNITISGQCAAEPGGPSRTPCQQVRDRWRHHTKRRAHQRIFRCRVQRRY